ncbi:MAG: prepilin-type N-terminal cleavage/methylation domain-containing protein [Opitutaceae bacterium]|nr:prepilin-type N-terminal cleavage/methylation domain-containing protein [Opitutaceae bacterium]
MNTTTGSRKRGMTLTEVMVALALSVVIGGMATYFIIQGTRASLRTTASTENDLVQWSISSRLQVDSKLANGAVIYRGLDSSSIDFDKRCTAGARGNLLVLSLSSSPNGSRASSYEKITGYLFDPADRVLRKFEHEVSTADRTAGTDLETIIKNNMAAFSFTIVARNVETIDSDGPFINRDLTNRNVNAAAATFRLTQGSVALQTRDSILVEIAFLIRS